MNAMLRYAALFALAVLATACASTPDSAAAPTPGSPQDATDVEYVAAVESVARKRGVLVRWVHPPEKRVKAVAAN